jgi:hypothetical protein
LRSAPARGSAAWLRFFAGFSFTLSVVHAPAILLRKLSRTCFGRDQLAPDA